MLITLTVPLFLLSPLKGSLRTFRLCILKQIETIPSSDPKAASSFALPTPIGQVVTSDPQDSITRETLDEQLFDYNVGFGITAIQSDTTGTAHTIFTTIEHGLNGIISVGIADSGAGYGSGSAGQIYNAKLVSGDDTVGLGSTGGTGATARLTVNAAGNITAVKVMEGGGAYRVGDFLNVVGVGTTTGYSAGIVTVTGIRNNIGDTLELHP